VTGAWACGLNMTDHMILSGTLNVEGMTKYAGSFSDFLKELLQSQESDSIVVVLRASQVQECTGKCSIDHGKKRIILSNHSYSKILAVVPHLHS
jgi:hypothetical protein